jgi:hypothetical protein
MTDHDGNANVATKLPPASTPRAGTQETITAIEKRTGQVLACLQRTVGAGPWWHVREGRRVRACAYPGTSLPKTADHIRKCACNGWELDRDDVEIVIDRD